MDQVFDFAVTDVIGDWGVTKSQLTDFLATAGGNPVNINISSPGGDVDHALCMYNALRAYPGNVTAKLSGIVASSATIIACGADNVQMGAGLFMIHNPAMGQYGEADDLRKSADILDKVKAQIVATYQKKANSNGKNKKASEISALMNNETWMDADEAIKNGFVNSKMNDSAGKPIHNFLQKFNNEIFEKLGYKAGVPMNKIELIEIEPMENTEKVEGILNTFLTKIENLFTSKQPEPAAQVVEVPVVEAPVIDNSATEAMQAKLIQMEADMKAIKDENARLQGTSSATAPISDPTGKKVVDARIQAEANLANALGLDQNRVYQKVMAKNTSK